MDKKSKKEQKEPLPSILQRIHSIRKILKSAISHELPSLPTISYPKNPEDIGNNK
jgi:hypothetical protein